MIDVSNTANKEFREVGFFDTYPSNNGANFNGAWNVYPYLPSGNIVISDINSGLFVIRKK
jgi:choice-of-anchor B domain-containing protein